MWMGRGEVSLVLLVNEYFATVTLFPVTVSHATKVIAVYLFFPFIHDIRWQGWGTIVCVMIAVGWPCGRWRGLGGKRLTTLWRWVLALLIRRSLVR